jgi:SPOR domain
VNYWSNVINFFIVLVFLRKNTMMMKKILFFIIMLCVTNVFAQKVTIKEDPVVTQMMDKFTSLNKQKKNINGWRIQISSTTDRRMMDEAVKNFERAYPDVPLTWIHAKPYYQVRVGAFKTKLESSRLLSILKVDYPAAYSVQDNTIKPIDLIGK